MLGTLLLALSSLLLVASLPRWPHSRTWGYAPSGTVGFVLLSVAVQVWLGAL